jgi:polysaccharide pyruvyl transferase WcaK-like protein
MVGKNQSLSHGSDVTSMTANPMDPRRWRFAFLYGFLGTNVGDVALTQGAIGLLRAAGMRGPATFVVPALTQPVRDAWRTITRDDAMLSIHEWDLRLSALRNEQPPSIETLDDIIKSDELTTSILRSSGAWGAECLFYTGGEHLFSYGNSCDDWALFGRLLPYLLSGRRGKPIIVLPSTFGPFKSDFSRKLLTRFLHYCSVVGARDLTSAAFIEELGLPRPRFALDPAFFIDCGVKGHCAATTPVANIVMRLEGSGLRVGAHLTKKKTEVFAATRYRTSCAFQLYRNLAAELAHQGTKIRVFIQCHADAAAARALHQEITKNFPSAEAQLIAPSNPIEFVASLSGASVTLTSRVHAAIFSLLAGCPPIGLYFREHGHKMPGMFEGLGCADMCFDATADFAHLADRVVATIESRDVYERALPKLHNLKDETLRYYSSYVPQIA